MLFTSLSCTTDKKQLMSSCFFQTLTQMKKIQSYGHETQGDNHSTNPGGCTFMHLITSDKEAVNAPKKNIKSPLLSPHTLRYIILACCSVLIIHHDDFASDCCASGTSSAIYILKQHKIITPCLSVNQGFGSRSAQYIHSGMCGSFLSVCFITSNSHKYCSKAVLHQHLFFIFKVICSAFSSSHPLAGLYCQSSLDSAGKEIKIILVQDGYDRVPQSSLAISIHPSSSRSPFCPNLSPFLSFLVRPTLLFLCPFILLKPFFNFLSLSFCFQA